MSRRVKTQNIISIIFLSLVALLALSFCIVLLLRNAALKKEEEAVQSELDALNEEGYYTTTETQVMIDAAKDEAQEAGKESVLDDMQTQLESGTSAISTIRSVFTDQLVVADSGRYFFFPITDEIEHHGFGTEDFTFNDDGFLEYTGEDSSVEILNGIDVSKFQGEIDWESVAASGIDFAIIRAGVRGSTEGKILEDDTFQYNIENAIANGIEVGVYFYSQAITDAEAEEEAQFVLDLIEPYEITYPVVIDIESADSSSARTYEQTQSQYTSGAKKFCELVEGAGYEAMIYGNVKSFTLLMDLTLLTDYDTWIAYYGTPLYYPYEFGIWQYSSSGSVDGIEGEVDLNIAIKNYAAD
ncbi:MAG: glycoside hydrolase family 25 protein [Butyrivibrio sp.]|nr:glycoside hydrolase family 25 protein [Butyrivibrio sp.]